MIFCGEERSSRYKRLAHFLGQADKDTVTCGLILKFCRPAFGREKVRKRLFAGTTLGKSTWPHSDFA